MKKILKYIIFVIFLFGILACGVKYQLDQAKKLEKDGYFIEAIKKYIKISQKNKNKIEGANALYNAARIYHRRLKVYSEAKKIYNEIIEKYSKFDDIVKLAKIGIFDSPNYFPFNDGSIWIEGDSDTGGKNMRIEWKCISISTYTKCIIQRKFFAGDTLATQLKRYYTKDNFQLQETPEIRSVDYTILLSYPFDRGKSWLTVRDGRKLKITIVDNNVNVKVKAGEFVGCIKIKEENPEFPQAFKYEYYAPETGHVLTTVASIKSEKEHRNNELIHYELTE